MNRFIAASIFILAVSLACAIPVAGIPSPTPAPDNTPAGTRDNTSDNTATVVKPIVNVRAEPDSGSAGVGVLEAGDRVLILECGDYWCQIKEPAGADWDEPVGWIWRGCLSDNPGRLGCAAK